MGECDAFAEAAEDNHGMIFAVQLGAIEGHGHPDVNNWRLGQRATSHREPPPTTVNGISSSYRILPPMHRQCRCCNGVAIDRQWSIRHLIVADLIFFGDEVAAEERA